MNKKVKQTLPLLGAQTLSAALLLSAGSIYANEANPTACEKDANCDATELEAMEKIKVHGVRQSVYRFDQSGDARRVADLVDTPQVITVLTQDQIQEAGKTDLKDILSAQAGVTLGTGENGNAFGDRYIIRGHEARSDVFVDGLRDPGMTTRESFATERVEIAKGPSSTFAGRGSSGGAVNSITKKASTSYQFGRVDAGIGSDDYLRITTDFNMPLSDNSAVRVNLLKAEDTKPGRDGIERERQGAQLSAVWNATEQLSFVADGYFMDATEIPDLGSYFDRDTRKPLENIPVYAQDTDFLDSEVSTFTLRTEYIFSDNLKLTNATRTGTTENGYITTGMRATTRHDTDAVAPGAATMSLSTHQGWQEVDYLASQFNLFWSTQALGMKHQWVFGLEYSEESVDNGVYQIAYGNEGNCSLSGRGGVSLGYCITDGQGQALPNIAGLMARSHERGDSDALFDIETVSIYVMDTVQVNDATQLFFGFRQDSFDYSNDTLSRGNPLNYAYSDDMYNGHLGLVYDLSEDANVYVSYSTATNINGGESDLGANCGYGGICGTPDQASQADPEIVENIEIGTKWMVFDDRVMVSAAWFQMTKDDVMESVGDAYSTLGTLNTGKNRIKGVEVGLVGDVTDALSIQLSAASMSSEVLDSYNEQTIGLALSNFADKSLYAQVRYQINDDWVVGGDFSYQSEMYGGQPDTAAGYDSDNGRYSIVVPDYKVVGLFANYNASEQLTFRLNVGNALDEEYWTAAYRSGSFMYLGDGRSVRLTATYEFN